MASAALSTGEERLDLLIRLVPVIYPGSDIIVDGLSVLTAVMINDTQCCSSIGVSDAVRYKLEEIRSIRQSNEDIDDVDVDVLYDFYYDVMRCYAGAERRLLTESEFKKMADFDPMTSLKGVIDGEFGKIHDALATLGVFYLPEGWRVSGITQFRTDKDSVARKRQSYCYIRMFKPEIQLKVASILGPRPVLGSVLSLLSPRVARPGDQLEGFFVVRGDNNDLHLTRNHSGRLYLEMEVLIRFQDDEEHRASGLLSIFDRIGAAPMATSHDNMFEQALQCLTDIVESSKAEEINAVEGSYKMANVDFTLGSESVAFPLGAETVRTIHNNGYTPSFIKTWKPKVREEALVIALKEYDDRVLNLHVASAGLSQLCASGTLPRCGSFWRDEVSEMVCLSKTDADYWFEVVEELAEGFRDLVDSPLPDWLVDVFHKKTEEFHSTALNSVAAGYRPPGRLKDPPMTHVKHSRSGSGSSSSSRDSKGSGSTASSGASMVSSHATRARNRLPFDCKARFDYLNSLPDKKIPGFISTMPLVHYIKLTGEDSYQGYRIKYIESLVLKELKKGSLSGSRGKKKLDGTVDDTVKNDGKKKKKK